MGGGGGGGGAVIELPKNLNDVVDTAINVGTQWSTGGLVGYEEGRLKQGAVTRGVDEAIGEVTGRNMARDQAWLAQQRLDQEAADRARMLANEAEARRLADLQASFAGGRGRGTAGSKGGRSMAYQPLGSQTDFLGL
jgi:hypothetical protein